MSKRFDALASLVDTKNVFDVGCDHGLLSIMLSKSHNVVASDITDYSVSKTLENVKKSSASIKVLKSDGLSLLEPKAGDTILLAGMGTYTILKILKKDLSKLTNTLIIQANNNHDILRYELVKLGYFIDKEITLYENRWYTIIRFKKGYRKYHKIDYITGPNPNIEYLKFILKIYEDKYRKIPNKYIFKKIDTYFIVKKLKSLIK